MLKDGSKLIAICSADNCAEYNNKFLMALNEEAKNFPFNIIFFTCFSSLFALEKHDLGESHIFQLMNHDMLDGIIMLSETIKNDDIRQTVANRALERNIPVVSIEHPLEGCFNIVYEYSESIKRLIEHLITDHHYTRINFLAGIPGNVFSEERLQIYRDVLTEHGIPVEEERIGYGEFWSDPTKLVLDQFLQSDLPFPEAIVCANDTMAITTLHYLTDAGYRIPEDVAITGFDGIEEALEHIPPITTIQYDYEKTAHEAYQILLDLFQGKTPPTTSCIQSQIVYGTTCGCPAKVQKSYNNLNRYLYERLDAQHRFNEIQIAMAADLIDNNNFQEIFMKLMRYNSTFGTSRYWLCIVDDLLNETEELSDILSNNMPKRSSYSNHMDMMLANIDGQWQGMTDFNTADLLPHLEQILKENDNLMFLPLHVLEHTIGYIAIVYEPEKSNMTFLYQLLMNISNALETTKIRQRQQNIIMSLETKYIHDPMTGLHNRRGFYQKCQPLYEECIQKQQIILVASIDLNGLKYINDTFGHADGDIAITTVGHALSNTMTEHTACARFGGDEFIAARQIDTPEEADQFRQDIQNYLDDFNANSGKPYEVSASIGIIYAVPNADITLDDFMKYADEKMYEEKAQHHLRRKD